MKDREMHGEGAGLRATRLLSRRMRFVAAAAAAGAFVLSTALALAGCAAGQPSGQAASVDASAGAAAGGAAAEEAVPLTFVLDWTPNTNHTGLYVAQERGYYADAGLDVTIVQPPEGDADALLGTGQAQLGMSFQDVMANYLGGADPLPVTAIAAVVQHNTSGIMSRAGEGMESPAGLVGKRYSTWDQAVEQAMLQTLVEDGGGAWDSVQLIPSGATDELGGLRAGMYDAVWVYEAWGVQNAVVEEYPIDYFSFRDVDETFDYYTPVIIANDAWLAQHPDEARAFLAATAKGYADAVADPDDAAEVLLAAAPELDPDLVQASQRYLASRYVDDAPQWGYIDPERWSRFYAWMNDEGLTSAPLDVSSGFTNDYLPRG